MIPEVDKYISSLGQAWQRDIIAKLRSAIHGADPEIEEKIKWGTPAFEHAGQVAWLFCAKDWVHFAFAQGALLDASHGKWEEGPDTDSKAKRTIKFSEGDKVPVALVKRLVKEAVANNKAGKKVDFKIPKPGEREFDVPREYQEMLQSRRLYEEYKARPYYQQKGWIQWIEAAKQRVTREKRLKTMFRELQTGQYMPNKRDRLY